MVTFGGDGTILHYSQRQALPPLLAFLVNGKWRDHRLAVEAVGDGGVFV